MMEKMTISEVTQEEDGSLIPFPIITNAIS